VRQITPYGANVTVFKDRGQGFVVVVVGPPVAKGH
jgi:hypothetical protein